VTVKRLDSSDKDFEQAFARLLDRDTPADAAVETRVREIVNAVRKDGDAALLAYTQRLDRHVAKSVSDLAISRDDMAAAAGRIPAEQRAALERAAERVRAYHERQKIESWSYTETDGTLLGQQVTTLDRVGLYVPGGKAAYPSSVLMNAIPAKVAGVSELVMVVPTPDGVINDLVLAAAHIAGVDRGFAIGGAQAVAALAYGTHTVPRVDKIVGPGNIYVATAKRLVFGAVDIDMIAGPSEIVIVSDGSSEPDWVAMDLFSQAEHDEEAQSILISADSAFIDKVTQAIDRLLPTMERKDVIAASLSRRGALIRVHSLDEAIALVNRIAPEHLELSLRDPMSVAKRVRHAGAIFLGAFTAEVLGDYCAGPNHVLPTAGTARFSSPLGVYDFQKRTSLIMCSEQGADALARTASALARGEGLTAHARSAEYRIKK